MDCSGSPVRYLCPATRIGEATPFDAPSTPTSILGITIAVRNSRTVVDAAMETAGGSLLVMHNDRISVRPLRPTNSAEREELASVIGDVSRVLKGQGDAIWVSRTFESFAADPPATELSALALDDLGGSFDNGKSGRVYKVDGFGFGTCWIVLEVAPGATFLSVFPDAPRKVI